MVINVDRRSLGGPRPGGILTSIGSSAPIGIVGAHESPVRTDRRPEDVVADKAEQPAGQRPGHERHGNLQSEPDDERGRGEEHRDPAAVNEPFDVLLKNEGRETDQREGSGGRRIRARTQRREDHRRRPSG